MNFKNLSWKKLDIVLEYRNPPLVCWLHVYRQRRKELEIGHFATFRPLWPWPWIRSYDLPNRRLTTQQFSFKSEKNFWWTDSEESTYKCTAPRINTTSVFIAMWTIHPDITDSKLNSSGKAPK